MAARISPRFPGKQDVLRYVLTANAPETKDNNFTWKDFQARNNNELVAILGNFVNRALVLDHKYFEGKVPACGPLQDIDIKAFDEIKEAVAAMTDDLENFKFREALRQAMNVARIGNKYLADCEPWKLWKTDPARVATILNVALQMRANLAVVFEPFTPFMAEDLRKTLGIDCLSWDMAGRTDILTAGSQLGEAHLLFEKIEDAPIEAQVQKLLDTKKQNELKAWTPER